MKVTKKFLVPLLLVIMVALSAFAFKVFVNNVTVYADSGYNLTNADYTADDRLIHPNGIPSAKTIQIFSSEVKSASDGTAFPELSQVIPLQYLESDETNAVFQYNGEEYGFYVAKEGNYFDVLLIDFVYEFEDGIAHSDIEYKIRIKPILQQTFLRSEDDNGDYIWTKSTLSNYRYYVSNPRFISVVQNENALNFGDSGYSKTDDDGVIIQQVRVNYGKISYATEEDFAENIIKFALSLLFDAGCSILDVFLPGNVGSIIG